MTRETSGASAEPVILVTRSNVEQVCRNKPFHARLFLSALVRMEFGALTVKLPDGGWYRFVSPGKGPDARLVMHNWNLPRRALTGGSIGAGESYMDGDWESPDMAAFMELFALNERVADELTTPGLLQNLWQSIRHWLHANTRAGSRRNIAAHYDLGNRFYSRWLDATMTYSSAIFEKRKSSLADAQQSKYRSIAERAGIRPGDNVLEIGCGWGGFAEFAAKNFGCKVTGLTISREQENFARERMFKAGLNDRVEIRFQDYRDEKGMYDRIASIEMFEAVGEKYWPVYFAKLRECLKAGGRAGLQIITIADRSFERYRRQPDFIQRYIFPGGMLPSPSVLGKLGAEAGLRQVAERIFPLDYARTLAEWRTRFNAAWNDIRKEGFDERFRRMWEFYLYYCEAGFRAGNIDVRQVFLQK
jgi:cyclopropane-fatty-acyl-phospholipid synthase